MAMIKRKEERAAVDDNVGFATNIANDLLCGCGMMWPP